MFLVVAPGLVNVTVLLERKALIPVELKVIMVVRLIVPWNPLVAVRFRLEVAFVPRGSVRTLGLSDRVKSGVGVAKVGMVPWNVGLDIARGPNVAATRRMAITAADKRGNRKKYQDICLTLLLFRLGPLENRILSWGRPSRPRLLEGKSLGPSVIVVSFYSVPE